MTKREAIVIINGIVSDYKANIPLHMLGNKYKLPIHVIIEVLYSMTVKKKDKKKMEMREEVILITSVCEINEIVDFLVKKNERVDTSIGYALRQQQIHNVGYFFYNRFNHCWIFSEFDYTSTFTVKEFIEKYNEHEKTDNGFTKYDQGKPNLAILFDTPNALARVADIMQYGANKYDRKNWDKVEDKERYISATLRHIAEYLQGNCVDVESGKNHLAHAITSLLFVLELDERERIIDMEVNDV